MRSGEVFAGRFELERAAGHGGMGAVWRARDRETGGSVAVKVILYPSPDQVARFRREARALADVAHPGIAQHIAHGVTDDGRHYLVMEWFEGEDLAARLRRGPLGIHESLVVVERVAEALGVVHARGVVHRDIKPANLFLPEGDVAQVKVLDFGIARLVDATCGLTDPGAPIGTPAYMAPEQVRAEPDIDARVDVYALGCVLFECLTGHPPFTAEHALAVLAKVVFEEPPRPSELRHDVPAVVDALVVRLVAKDRADRPADAASAANEIRACRTGEQAPRADAAPALTRAERRLVSVVLAGAAQGGIGPTTERGAAAATGEPETVDARATTLPMQWAAPLLTELRRVAQAHGARLELLQDGSVVALVAGASAAVDLAAGTARCALALRALLPNADMAVATGWDVVEEMQPVGQVIDRAAARLASRAEAPRGGPAIPIDDMTAALLGPRFQLVSDPSGPAIMGEHEPFEEGPLLLGKPTPFVGRDRELRALEDLFRESAGEPCARAVLVTAPAGFGKSRLRIELVQRLRKSGEPLEVWVGHGDSIRAGAALGLLGQLVRRAARLADGEPVEHRREKLAARVARFVAPDIRGRVTEFLGQMVGVPFSDAGSVQLRAARQDPRLMGDQMLRAWVDFLQAECRAHPVLLILEDLHWSDLPTVDFIDAALRILRNAPLLVLALARLEVRETFPSLWATREMTEMRLGPLSPQASERLTRAALGEHASTKPVNEIVQRAAGQPLLLEELVRAVADGKDPGETPETALAMVHARLEVLEPDARRILRAGSVFGEVFWQGAVATLLGRARGEADLSERLAELERREWIARQLEPRFEGEVEYAFRHALVREAAFGMLTERDRALGHRLAGAWLEQVGENDAAVVAEHFEHGGAPERALTYYRRAAEQALRGNDFDAALAWATRGVECVGKAPDAEILGALRFVQAEAHLWRGELVLAGRRATQAVEGLPLGSAAWFRAVAAAAIATGKLGDYDGVERWAELAREVPAGDGAASAKWRCLADSATRLAHGGRYGISDALCEAIDVGSGDRATPDAEVTGRLHVTRAIRALAAGEEEAARRGFEVALAAFERAGDHRNACVSRGNLGYVEGELGDYERAEATLRAALADADRMGLTHILLTVLQNLGNVLARRGRLEEAKMVLQKAVEGLEKQRDPRMTNGTRTYLARAAALAGDFGAAEREARAAAEALRVAPPMRAPALAVLSSALLALGRAAEALAAAEEAMEVLRTLGQVEEGESLVRLAHAVALAEAGRPAEAAAAIAAARDRLLARAAKIADPDARWRFLAIAENAETLARAEAWIADSPAPAGD